ncbi:hypothetical protein RRF57_011603 [Xylaria bambusicola]|uniref:Uncharacterized protein n=1 Tax=Xylaria bambusicola TaxID=326684 RepID=A0AAN7UZQ8_9PEZI
MVMLVTYGLLYRVIRFWYYYSFTHVVSVACDDAVVCGQLQEAAMLTSTFVVPSPDLTSSPWMIGIAPV